MYSLYPFYNRLTQSALFIRKEKEFSRPGAIKVLISSFVQLHTLTIEFLLDNELTALHLLDGLLDRPRGTLAKHGGERTEELYRFILQDRRENSAEHSKPFFYYLCLKSSRRIPKLPSYFFEVGACIIQILRVWMENGKHRRFFDRYHHI